MNCQLLRNKAIKTSRPANKSQEVMNKFHKTFTKEKNRHDKWTAEAVKK